MVKALLAGKANPNLADERGVTPLMSAAKAGDEAIIKLLLEAGAKPDIQTGGPPAAAKPADGEQGWRRAGPHTTAGGSILRT